MPNFVQQLALLAASIERFAVEIRNLQRTDVLEVEEYFSKNQKRFFSNASQT